MSLPTLATSEDIDAVINYLRSKPLGAALTEAKATLSASLLDPKRLSAYESWDLVKVSNNKLVLTSLGREYSQASSTKKSEIFSNILLQEKIYFVTVEYIYHRNVDQISADDVAVHWAAHFSDSVATGSERALKEQVTCFMGVAAAAGLGEYLIGRKGQPTRFVVNRNALAAFMTKSDKDGNGVSEDVDEEKISSENVASSNETRKVIEPITEPYPPRSLSNTPSLHIDIQIHIDSEATPEQIDKIFESMAKHLYNRDSK